jgi:hypothetical protein
MSNMIRASNSEAIRRRKFAAALVGGGTAMAALTTVGVFAASGGFDRLTLNGGEESSSPQLRGASTTIASPSLRPSASPNSGAPTATESDFPTNVGVPATLEPTDYPTATKSIPPTDLPGVPTSLEPTVFPTATESDFPTNVGVPATLEPTDYPTATKSNTPTSNVSEFPSTRSLLINMTNTTNVPSATPTTSSNPTDESSKGTFRIRMHWQPGLFYCFVILLLLLLR